MNRLCFYRAWILCLLLGGLPFHLAAQIAGRINGRAVDPSGATIASVRLTLTASDTKVSRTGLTGADGFYEFADVLPGKYVLTAEAPGFQKQVISNVTLEVAQVLRQDINLVLGATSERVDVTASEVALQTEDSQVGGVVETKAVNDLPLNGRDFTQLMILLPGASEGTPSGTTGKHYTERVAGLSFSVNGQRSNYNQFLIDGFMAKEVQSGTAAVSPIIDSLMEFRVQSSNYSAQFGTEAGGQVNTVLRSGTNDLHGTLWEYLRNDDFDANDFFSNLSGRSKGEYRRNQFGAAGGGPVHAAEVQWPQPHFHLRRLRGHQNDPGRYSDTHYRADRQPTPGHLHIGDQRSTHWHSVPEQPDSRQPHQFDQQHHPAEMGPASEQWHRNPELVRELPIHRWADCIPIGGSTNAFRTKTVSSVTICSMTQATTGRRHFPRMARRMIRAARTCWYIGLTFSVRTC